MSNQAEAGAPGPALGKVLLLTGMAGGLGWGVRGQYGHETGAMMAGLLVALTLVSLFCPGWPSLSAARAVALMTVAMGFGGSMTYGQTIGLTQDAPLVGRWAAWGWGMLGLGLKGGLWVGFAGAFLGLGVGGLRYRPAEMLAIFGGMLFLYFAGVWLLNEPYDPAGKILPAIYFSDDWRWEPDAALKPRRENWGGLLLALLGLVAYLGIVRRDRLAVRLAGWAVLGGAVGFPLGQCLQSFHAWNPELFRSGLAARIDPLINWWNMMETTFGATFGMVLGLGVWRNRRALHPARPETPPGVASSVLEWALLIVYVPLLVCWEFFDQAAINALAEPGISMGLLPAVALVAGRGWPYWIALPLTIIPIAGKTLRQLAYKEAAMEPWAGWLLCVALPLALTVTAAVAFRRRGESMPAGRGFLGDALLLNTALYFGLNFAFFRFPWPWETWTARTPNALIYVACALGLAWLGWQVRKAPRAGGGGEND